MSLNRSFVNTALRHTFPKANGSRGRQRAVEQQGGAQAAMPAKHIPCRRSGERKEISVSQSFSQGPESAWQ